LRVMEV